LRAALKMCRRFERESTVIQRLPSLLTSVTDLSREVGDASG